MSCSSARVARAEAAPASSFSAVADPAWSTMAEDCSTSARASASRASNTWFAFCPAWNAASESWSTCSRAEAAWLAAAARVPSAAAARASMAARVWASSLPRCSAAACETDSSECSVDWPNSSRSAWAVSARSRNWAAASAISRRRLSPPLRARSFISAAETRAWLMNSPRVAACVSASAAKVAWSALRACARLTRAVRCSPSPPSMARTCSETPTPAVSRRAMCRVRSSPAVRAASLASPAAAARSAARAVSAASASRSWVSARSDASATIRACWPMLSTTLAACRSRVWAMAPISLRSRPRVSTSW